MTPFERELQRQPFRDIPVGWRAQILPQPPPAESAKRLGWMEWLWPSPLAWAALATVWIGVFALGKMAPVSAPVTSQASGDLVAEAVSPFQLFAYREQLLVQLIAPKSLSHP